MKQNRKIEEFVIFEMEISEFYKRNDAEEVDGQI